LDPLNKKIVLIFLVSLLITLTVGFPAIYLTDEWISANQLNHLVTGKDPFYGFEPYQGGGYATSLENTLVYTLALPIISYPAYQILNLFGDSFRLFIIGFWSALIILIILLQQAWYRQYSKLYGIPLIYPALFFIFILIILNSWLYQQFDFSKYGEVAAIVFTNEICFAIFSIFTFLIFREIFESDWWGIFGWVSTITCSSYLFWSGNAKDHMLTFLFIVIAVYFFILFVKKKNYLYLISSFISIGLLAWVRPELGFTVAVGFFIGSLIITIKLGWHAILKSLVCSSVVFFGAIPLFINNYAFSGNPLTPPIVRGPVTLGFFSPRDTGIDQLTIDIFKIFVNPSTPGVAGIFQVSPISVFALMLPIVTIYNWYFQAKPISEGEQKKIIFFIIILMISVMLPYLNVIYMLPNNLGINPDIRYLSPLYLPLLILGVFALKWVGFDENDIRKSFRILLILILVILPIIFLVYQIGFGKSLNNQITINMILTYLILFMSLIFFLLVMVKKIGRIWLVYSLPVVMLMPVLWELIVDFRFASIVWEGYHFWIPVIQYIWYIQSFLFHMV
jgi:hypothetical protein